MSAAKLAKATLRKKVAEKIATLSQEEIKRQSKLIFEKILNTQAFKESQRISIYCSLPHEVDTKQIIRTIFETQKQCFVPRYKNKVMEMVKLDSIEDWEQLPTTKWNIKQPSFKDVRENAMETGGLDLIIVPGVAFTADGNRLGHGAGYYDKFLTNAKKVQKIPFKTIGLALDVQIMEKVPLEKSDVKIDTVLYV